MRLGREIAAAAISGIVGFGGLGAPVAAAGRYSEPQPTENQGAIKPEFRGFLDVVNSLVNTDAEPEFFALMEKRLAGDPDKYFAYTYVLGYDEYPSGHYYLYYPDLDIQDPKNISPGIVLFVNDSGSGDLTQTPATIDLQFNEFGKLGRTEKSPLFSFQFTVEGLTQITDEYLKTTDEVRSLHWELYVDIFGNPSYILRKQNDIFAQQITFSGHATNRAMFNPQEIRTLPEMRPPDY